MTVSTIRDVAKTAGVSIGTVSNYLNCTKPVSASTRIRIDKAIAALNFVPNRASKVMRGANSQVIGLVVPDTTNPFFGEVGRGIEDQALANGLVVVTCNTDGDSDRESIYLRALHEMRVTGIIITPTQAGLNEVWKLKEANVAVVLLNHPRDGRKISAVSGNDFAGGELAMRHLLSLGCREVLYIGSQTGEHKFDSRYDGAVTALREAGHNSPGLRRINVLDSSVEAKAHVGELIASLTPLPEGIFCANDSIALAVQATLSRHGIHSPNDIAIVGYDDIDEAQLAAVPLTTIYQPKYEQGTTAVDLLLAEVEASKPTFEEVIFDTRLIVRQSTGFVRAPVS